MDKNEDAADVALMLHHDINERVMTALVELLLYENEKLAILSGDPIYNARIQFGSILKAHLREPDIRYLILETIRENLSTMLFSMSNFQYQLNAMIENEVREQLKGSMGIIR